jgi:hypothetical protein
MSDCVGSDLCYWIVTDSGQVVSKMSVEHVTHKGYLSEDTKTKVKDFEKKCGDVLMILSLSYSKKMALV